MAEHIPILNGKAARYHKAILRVLYTEGPQESPWYLAKELSPLLRGETRNIYSVLIRTNGRLEHLAKHDYIYWTDDSICIGWRGVWALLIAEPDILHKIHPDMYEVFKTWSIEAIEEIPDKATTPFGLTISGHKEAAKKTGVYKLITTLEGWKKQAEYVEELVREGINLDLIKRDTLLLFIGKRFAEKFRSSRIQKY